jgi:hypothetical protein
MKLQSQAGSQYGLPQPLYQAFAAPVVSNRAPISTDTGHPIGRIWVNKGSAPYILIDVSGGVATWYALASV